MTVAATTGLVLFLVMFVLVLIGAPIYLSMFLTSVIGFFCLGGTSMMVQQITNAPFTLAASYTYAVLPLFMLMGSLSGDTGIAKGAYSSMRVWLGRRRGGLLYATIGANAIFGACSGISLAGSVVFSKIALPELERSGYDRDLSLGCITGSSCLSCLIPPSIPIIQYCILTNLSIGTALMCGLSVGIITVIVMFVVTFVIARVQKGKVPEVSEEDKAVTWKIRLASLKLLLPILILFGLIIGGTFSGWFSATVGGAIGSAAVVIYSLFKRIPLKQIAKTTWEAATMNAGMFPIIIAGTLFSRFITLTGLPDAFSSLINAMNIPAFGVFIMVIIFYLFCGCVMDIASTIIITVPIVFPLLTGLGFDGYMLCIVLVFVSSMAGVTPPIGMNVFAVANTVRIDPSHIFKGVIPYFVAQLAVVFIIAIWQPLIYLVPNLIGLFVPA